MTVSEAVDRLKSARFTFSTGEEYEANGMSLAKVSFEMLNSFSRWMLISLKVLLKEQESTLLEMLDDAVEKDKVGLIKAELIRIQSRDFPKLLGLKARPENQK